MNPIERAVARSEKGAAANNALESTPSLRGRISSLKHGETATFRSPESTGEVKVSYHERQSHGDNGQPVRGATVGGYLVEYPNGKTESFDHGPHANTPAAAKRGANPNAKPWAAGNAHQAITTHFAKSRVFNHQGPAPQTGEHPARLTDDAGSGYNQRCKDCGKPITWTGPNHSDWQHV